MAKMLVSDFGGVVPSDVDQLQKLPGVGRKTANVIALGRLQPADDGSRHARLPRSQPHRADKQQQNPIGNRERAGQAHPEEADSDCPPLAHPARTLYLHGA